MTAVIYWGFRPAERRGPDRTGWGFNDVHQKGEPRFSWQPESGVRSAAVITHISGTTSGFALAGRSLKEVEKREDQLFQFDFVGWLAGCIIFGSIVAFRLFIIRKLGKEVFSLPGRE